MGGVNTRPVVETHLDYARRVGAPRVVVCDVDVSGFGGWVFVCRTHDYRFNDRGRDGGRCPMSRLEEWRARKWEAAA